MDNNQYQTRTSALKNDISISQKLTLSLSEAAAYSGIGINKLKELTNEPNCNFVLWKGSHRMIKRKQLEKYIESVDRV